MSASSSAGLPLDTSWARRLAPGLILSGALGLLGMSLGQIPWFQAHGFSALTVAIVLGMFIGNTVYPSFAAVGGEGVNFSKQRLLRLGIVFYGLRLTVQDIGHVGLVGVLIDMLVILSTFGLALALGKLLDMDRKTVVLIGIGNAICGAAAVLAAEPVVRARAEQVTVAIATVVVFGTLSIFLYPVLFELNQPWQLVPGGIQGFGVYAGSTIHEVAQVVAAARSISTELADTAVISKMVRVMMLAPFLIMLSAWTMKADTSKRDAFGSARRAQLNVPWFAFFFVGMVLFNSLHWLPAGAVRALNEADTALLAIAMAALGLTTHLSAIRKAGVKPLFLAMVLFVWLVAGGAVINRWVSAALAA